jgi:hypothetical protein
VLLDTCMAAWNLVHQGKYGRLLDMLLSVFLVGISLFLLLNSILPGLTHWTSERTGESNRPRAVYAAGPTPQMQLSQATVTPEVTPAPTETLVPLSPACAVSSRGSGLSKDHTNKAVQRTTTPAAQPEQSPEASTGHSVNLPDLIPTMSDMADAAIAEAERVAAAQEEVSPDFPAGGVSGHPTMPGLGSLPVPPGKPNGNNALPPVKIPTPFAHPWHDKNGGVNIPALTPSSEETGLTPAAMPMHRAQAETASSNAAAPCLGNSIAAVQHGETMNRLRPLVVVLLPWFILVTIGFYCAMYIVVRRKRLL